MNNPVILASGAAMPFGERMAYGAQVMIIGILTVFLVLSVLWLALVLFKLFFYDIPEKKKKKAAPVSAPAVFTSPEEIPLASDGDDSQLAAVIAAAVHEYRQATESASLPFRVVSYRRAKSADGWSGKNSNETI